MSIMDRLKKPLFPITTILLFLLVFSISLGSAQTIETQRQNIYIFQDSVYVDSIISLSERFTGNFNLTIPADVKGISLYINDAAKAWNESYRDTIFLQDAQKINVKYSTKDLIEGNDFIYDFYSNNRINALEINVYLPEGVGLLRPFSGNGEGSAYPRPDEILSDGKNIILRWSENNIQEKFDLPIFIVMREKTGNTIWVYILISATIIIATLIFVYFVLRNKNKRKKNLEKIAVKHKKIKSIKKSKIKSAKKQPKGEPQKDENTSQKILDERYNVSEMPADEKLEKILSHLKEDEQQVVRILAQREGKCEQGTLRIVTNYPKSTLSRIISELEERNIVYKEKRGKKNLIFLKEKF